MKNCWKVLSRGMRWLSLGFIEEELWMGRCAQGGGAVETLAMGSRRDAWTGIHGTCRRTGWVDTGREDGAEDGSWMVYPNAWKGTGATSCPEAGRLGSQCGAGVVTPWLGLVMLETTVAESSPHSLQLERGRCSSEDPAPNNKPKTTHLYS